MSAPQLTEKTVKEVASVREIGPKDRSPENEPSVGHYLPYASTTLCRLSDTSQDHTKGYQAARELVINNVYAPESMRHSTRTLEVPTLSHPLARMQRV